MKCATVTGRRAPVDGISVRPLIAAAVIVGTVQVVTRLSAPDRVAGLIYLDAACSYAFDNGKGANVMEMQRLQAPQPPPPGSADLASFSALTKYYERVNGFRFPEGELRQQRISAPDGGVGKQRDFPGGALFRPLLMGTRKYIDIPAPALVIFANPHGLETWVDGNTDPTVLTAAKSYSSALAALTERQEKAVENGVPTAHVITLPGAYHYVLLTNAADVMREMRAFLTGLR